MFHRHSSFFLQLIKQHYERNHGMSLEKAIKKETSGDFETMLLALTMDPVAYYALQVPDQSGAICDLYY
ncbi:unnamed protein product, partial [Laminaria digitata]